VSKFAFTGSHSASLSLPTPPAALAVTSQELSPHSSFSRLALLYSHVATLSVSPDTRVELSSVTVTALSRAMASLTLRQRVHVRVVRHVPRAGSGFDLRSSSSHAALLGAVTGTVDSSSAAITQAKSMIGDSPSTLEQPVVYITLPQPENVASVAPAEPPKAGASKDMPGAVLVVANRTGAVMDVWVASSATRDRPVPYSLLPNQVQPQFTVCSRNYEYLCVVGVSCERVCDF
jgi:hypothetical protein